MQRVAQWERFFNGDSLKERLVSRYVYEHLFLAHLYFDDDPERAVLPAGALAHAARASRSTDRDARPFDDPGVDRVYYRLRPRARDHRRQDAHAVRAGRARAWRAGARCSSTRRYAVQRLPSYGAETASNPFVAFRELPVDARYRFMLDEARVHDHGLHQGPGVSRPGGAQRDQGSLLGRSSSRLRSGSDAAQSALLARDATCCACPPAAAARRS